MIASVCVMLIHCALHDTERCLSCSVGKNSEVEVDNVTALGTDGGTVIELRRPTVQIRSADLSMTTAHRMSLTLSCGAQGRSLKRCECLKVIRYTVSTGGDSP